ncbi:hypothetical protein RUND412_001556 [Rhizina undulata]
MPPTRRTRSLHEPSTSPSPPPPVLPLNVTPRETRSKKRQSMVSTNISTPQNVQQPLQVPLSLTSSSAGSMPTPQHQQLIQAEGSQRRSSRSTAVKARETIRDALKSGGMGVKPNIRINTAVQESNAASAISPVASVSAQSTATPGLGSRRFSNASTITVNSISSSAKPKYQVEGSQERVGIVKGFIPKARPIPGPSTAHNITLPKAAVIENRTPGRRGSLRRPQAVVEEEEFMPKEPIEIEAPQERLKGEVSWKVKGPWKPEAPLVDPNAVRKIPEKEQEPEREEVAENTAVENEETPEPQLDEEDVDADAAASNLASSPHPSSRSPTPADSNSPKSMKKKPRKKPRNIHVSPQKYRVQRQKQKERNEKKNFDDSRVFVYQDSNAGGPSTGHKGVNTAFDEDFGELLSSGDFELHENLGRDVGNTEQAEEEAVHVQQIDDTGADPVVFEAVGVLLDAVMGMEEDKPEQTKEEMETSEDTTVPETGRETEGEVVVERGDESPSLQLLKEARNDDDEENNDHDVDVDAGQSMEIDVKEEPDVSEGGQMDKNHQLDLDIPIHPATAPASTPNPVPGPITEAEMMPKEPAMETREVQAKVRKLSVAEHKGDDSRDVSRKESISPSHGRSWGLTVEQQPEDASESFSIHSPSPGLLSTHGSDEEPEEPVIEEVKEKNLQIETEKEVPKGPEMVENAMAVEEKQVKEGVDEVNKVQEIRSESSLQAQVRKEVDLTAQEQSVDNEGDDNVEIDYVEIDYVASKRRKIGEHQTIINQDNSASPLLEMSSKLAFPTQDSNNAEIQAFTTGPHRRSTDLGRDADKSYESVVRASSMPINCGRRTSLAFSTPHSFQKPYAFENRSKEELDPELKLAAHHLQLLSYCWPQEIACSSPEPEEELDDAADDQYLSEAMSPESTTFTNEARINSARCVFCGISLKQILDLRKANKIVADLSSESIFKRHLELCLDIHYPPSEYSEESEGEIAPVDNDESMDIVTEQQNVESQNQSQPQPQAENAGVAPQEIKQHGSTGKKKREYLPTFVEFNSQTIRERMVTLAMAIATKTLPEGYTPESLLHAKLVDPEVFLESIEAATTEEERLLAEENAVLALHAIQKEYVLLDQAQKELEAGVFPDRGSSTRGRGRGRGGRGRKITRLRRNPLEPEDHVIWEDKKEADLYGFQYDPAPEKRGNQDADGQQSTKYSIRGRELRSRDKVCGFVTVPGYEYQDPRAQTTQPKASRRRKNMMDGKDSERAESAPAQPFPAEVVVKRKVGRPPKKPPTGIPGPVGQRLAPALSRTLSADRLPRLNTLLGPNSACSTPVSAGTAPSVSGNIGSEQGEGTTSKVFQDDSKLFFQVNFGGTAREELNKMFPGDFNRGSGAVPRMVTGRELGNTSTQSAPVSPSRFYRRQLLPSSLNTSGLTVDSGPNSPLSNPPVEAPPPIIRGKVGRPRGRGRGRGRPGRPRGRGRGAANSLANRPHVQEPHPYDDSGTPISWDDVARDKIFPKRSIPLHDASMQQKQQVQPVAAAVNTPRLTERAGIITPAPPQYRPAIPAYQPPPPPPPQQATNQSPAFPPRPPYMIPSQGSTSYAPRPPAYSSAAQVGIPPPPIYGVFSSRPALPGSVASKAASIPTFVATGMHSSSEHHGKSDSDKDRPKGIRGRGKTYKTSKSASCSEAKKTTKEEEFIAAQNAELGKRKRVMTALALEASRRRRRRGGSDGSDMDTDGDDEDDEDEEEEEEEDEEGVVIKGEGVDSPMDFGDDE